VFLPVTETGSVPWDATRLRAILEKGGAEMELSWSTDPVAVALRDALDRLIREFPAVRCGSVSSTRRSARSPSTSPRTLTRSPGPPGPGHGPP